MKQHNVIKFSPRRKRFSEDLVMIQNLQQMIDAVVLRYGAHLVLANFPGMVQTAQANARAVRQQGKERKVGA
jgi:hypothetical protein